MIICPKCGNDTEFYTKERYKGTCKVYFRYDGALTNNSEMYDYAEHSYRSKFVFCAECDARVSKIEEVAELKGA